MSAPPRDHDDGQFTALSDRQIDRTRLILAAAILAYTATVFVLGFWAGGL